MGNPKANFIRDFIIILNDVKLDTQLGILSGASVDIQGTSGVDQLLIIANSSCGVEKVVLNKHL